MATAMLSMWNGLEIRAKSLFPSCALHSYVCILSNGHPMDGNKLVQLIRIEIEGVKVYLEVSLPTNMPILLKIAGR